jgi:hypothetical protein
MEDFILLPVFRLRLTVCEWIDNVLCSERHFLCNYSRENNCSRQVKIILSVYFAEGPEFMICIVTEEHVLCSERHFLCNYS